MNTESAESKDFEKQIYSEDVASAEALNMGDALKESQAGDDQRLKRVLHARHLSMIAIGGALGTGLLIGTGNALRLAGPAAIFLSYSVIGFVVYMVLTGLGEVATHIPLADGFAGYCRRYVDEALGFACGWTYLFLQLLVTANQLVAGSLTMQYWIDEERANPGIWIAVFLTVSTTINVLGVRFFGEVEFWVCIVKICTCIGLVILLLVIALGGGPSGDRLGFRFWQNPGAFRAYTEPERGVNIEGDLGRFVSFISVLVNSVFAYSSCEMVGVTFPECARPRKAIPKAIRLTFYRIVIFYVLNVLVLGMCVPFDDPRLLGTSGTNASASPFVIAIFNAQIQGLDHVINACILIFVTSAAVADMYIGSRTLYGLSMSGYAPKFFSKTDKRGVPYWGIVLAFGFGCLAFMATSSDSAEVFQHFVNVVSLNGLLAWSCILLVHVRFMRALKAQGYDRKKDLAFRSPIQPFGTYFSLGICVFVIFAKNFTVFLGSPFDYETFITGYIMLPVFIVLFLGWKFWHKTRFVRASEIDLTSFKEAFDIQEEKFLAQDEEDKAARRAAGNPINLKWLYEKIFGWVF
ncbi:uncharacterized protein CXQ87_004676 [Candidozyma duobushaemuli]|uniref:Amino acid permease/ SLC12A domain-containing protein n=1 Tax=Candidozyma duobushaemuli TaxID=1231522 RepID=A0A2V1AH96_9ASCO|nr:uncharacterized protein CXQ87_004676 [[Candida] duobushaemulonis]PVH17115.1 hypothetical protein CXQ87_004676 [[Candida] duobushaemulonis]